jgi:hypothetical protein
MDCRNVVVLAVAQELAHPHSLPPLPSRPPQTSNANEQRREALALLAEATE